MYFLVIRACDMFSKKHVTSTLVACAYVPVPIFNVYLCNMSIGYVPVPIFNVYCCNMSIGYVPVPIFNVYLCNMSIEYVPVPLFNVQLATRVYDMFSHKHATSIIVT